MTSLDNDNLEPEGCLPITLAVVSFISLLAVIAWWPEIKSIILFIF